MCFFIGIPFQGFSDSFQLLLQFLLRFLQFFYLTIQSKQFFRGKVVFLVRFEFGLDFIVGRYGGIPFPLDFFGNASIHIFTPYQLLQQFVTLVFLGCKEIGKRTLCDEYGTKKLVVIQTDNLRQVTPGTSFFRPTIFRPYDLVQEGYHIVISHPCFLHMPFRPIDISVIGKESKFTIAILFSTRQDVPSVGRCQPVTFIGIHIAIDFYLVSVILLSGITGSPIIQGQTDSIQNSGLTATRRTYNTENGTFAQSTFLKVDDFAFPSVQGSQMEYFKFQKFHNQSVVSFFIPFNKS